MKRDFEAEIVSVLDENRASASNKKGGGWMTSQCVVGDDMDRAIHAVSTKLATSPVFSIEDVKQFVIKIESAANDYSGVDMEGIVVGTMKWIAQQIQERVTEKEGPSA